MVNVLAAKNLKIMLLNQIGTTEEFIESYAKEFVSDGWKHINVAQPDDDQRILAIGDIEFEHAGYAVTNTRRMSLCRYSLESKKFYIADAEVHIPELINVKWWKPLTF